MSITNHLIADYLKRNGFEGALKEFAKQAEINLLTDSVNYEKLEDIVSDRISYAEHKDQILKSSTPAVAKNSINKLNLKLSSVNIPESNKELHVSSTLVVHISSEKFILDDVLKDVLFVSSTDKRLTLVDLSTGEILARYTGIHQSVTKCCYGIANTNKVLSCGMDGKIKLVELTSSDFTILNEVQLHKRLISDLKIYHKSSEEILIFSIGWDYQLKLTSLSLITNKLEIISSFKLISNATAIEIGDFQNHAILALTRLDSTQLVYFTVVNNVLVELAKISLNDAEFSTHGFTPMCIALSNYNLENDSIVFIGTSHVPYMRLITLKLPDLEYLLSNVDITKLESNQEQELSTPVQRGLILDNYASNSEQDKYSQPKIVFDGALLWISGDDGVIRGVDVTKGSVLHELKSHDQRIKCLLHHYLITGKSVFISTGIDKKLVYWF